MFDNLYMYFYLLVFLFLFRTNGFSNNPRLKFPSRLLMTKYPYAKEYFDYYNKFKKPMLLSNNNEKKYNHLIEKNMKSYLTFEKNFESIQTANKMLKEQNKTLRLDINQYMDNVDFDDDSSQNLMINTIHKPSPTPTQYLKMIDEPVRYFKDVIKNNMNRFSWNDTGLLSPVKNQKSCGSCWAFSTTSALETFMRKNNYNVTRLSEQELVDCSVENYGCNGGLMDLAMDYIIRRKGLSSNEEYSYNATESGFCNYNASRVLGSNMTEYKYIIPKSIIDMKYSVNKNPVAIALDADNVFFRFYKEGVIDIPINTTKTLNHAVLLTGYDYDNEGMYWIIQNSWGETWGDKGFCKIRVQPQEGTLLCQLYGVYPTK